MTDAGQFWAQAAALAVVDVDRLAPGAALVLAPHPDDESLGCGGFIAQACLRGRPPVVAVLTDGAGSHPNSRTHPAERLCALREHETRRATACLGLPPERLVFLRYADTRAPTEGAALHEAAARVAALLAEHACGTILAPWRGDPHGDHLAAHRIACAAAARARVTHWSYPVWGLTLPADHPVGDAPRGWRLDVSQQRAAKRRAILAHASQHAGLIGDDPSGFQMQPAFMALFDTDYELYLDPEP